MSKKTSKVLKAIMALTILFTTVSSVSFAAWWGTPGYEWVKSKGLTTMTNSATLNNAVSHDDFYSIILKYLNYKGVQPDGNIIQNTGEYVSQNKALEGFVKEINSYISRQYLSIDDYRHLSTSIEGIKRIIDTNQVLLTRDNLKDLKLYLTLAKYQGATMIEDRNFRTLVTSNLSPTPDYNVGYVKYKDLVRFNIRPYYGEISRKEFLVLMFSLLSQQNLSQEEIIRQFYETGILIGYNDGLMLEENLTYAEMFTFLRRFETFEFNPIVEESDGDVTDDGVIEYK